MSVSREPLGIAAPAPVCDTGAVSRWVWLIWLAASAALVWALSRDGVTAFVVALGLGLLFIAFWLSPWYGGISRKQRDVMAMAPEDRRLIIYWRPGDIFSTRLRGGLGKHAKRFIWINVWQDDEAQQYADGLGNGVYPVVMVDGEPHVNPDPRAIIPLI